MPLNRRQFLYGAAVTGASVAGLAGCGHSESHNTAQNNAKVKLPDYVPYRGAKADLPATADGILAAYFSYPQPPAKVSLDVPGKSDSVTAMMNIYNPPPPPAGRNKFWQELNSRLGTSLKLSMVPDSDYANKFATMIAGDDLPDIMMIAGSQPKRPQLLRARFQPLTEHLSGSAIKKYPFLANIPAEAWKSTVYDGEIYGIPLPRPIVGSITFLRTDIAEQRGADPEPKNYADFVTLCKALTDADRSHWALGDPNTILVYLQEMLGIPNSWIEKGGKFSSVYLQDEYRKALSSIRELMKAGDSIRTGPRRPRSSARTGSGPARPRSTTTRPAAGAPTCRPTSRSIRR